MIILLGQEPETVCYNYVATIHTAVHYAGKEPQHNSVSTNQCYGSHRETETKRDRKTEADKETKTNEKDRDRVDRDGQKHRHTDRNGARH